MIGCAHCELTGRCPVLNKAECPVNQLWEGTMRLDKAKRELVAEAERIIAAWNKIAR